MLYGEMEIYVKRMTRFTLWVQQVFVGKLGVRDAWGNADWLHITCKAMPGSVSLQGCYMCSVAYGCEDKERELVLCYN